jgi:hypothetical protein
LIAHAGQEGLNQAQHSKDIGCGTVISHPKWTPEKG